MSLLLTKRFTWQVINCAQSCNKNQNTNYVFTKYVKKNYGSTTINTKLFVKVKVMDQLYYLITSAPELQHMLRLDHIISIYLVNKPCHLQLMSLPHSQHIHILHTYSFQIFYSVFC